MPVIAATPAITLPNADQRDHLEWHTPGGVVFSLTDDTDDGIILMPGWTGGDMPPYALSTVDLPGGGSVLRGLRATARELTFPLHIQAATHADVRAKIRNLAGALNPKAGGGAIYLTPAAGSGRKIPARYTSGAEGANGVNESGLTWQIYLLKFLALDPMWLDLTDQGTSWQAANTVQFFEFELDGRQLLTQDSVLGDLLIGNPGDEDAYPIWTIAGTMTEAAFTNNDTGETFTLTYSQSTGHVTVDCRPGHLTVVDESDTNLWPDLADNPVLWALHPGDNSVSLVVSGTDGTTMVTLQYTPRYLTS